MKIRKAELYENIQRRSAINQQARENKNALRESLNKDIEAFMASGGVVQELDHLATTFLPPSDFVKKQRAISKKPRRQPFVINGKNHKPLAAGRKE